MEDSSSGNQSKYGNVSATSQHGTPSPSRRGFLAAGATIATGSLVGCLGGGGETGADGTATATPSEYPDEVIIGAIHPLTGSTSYTGTRCNQAIELAATVATENGGIESMDGADVRVISRDHANDPARAGEAVRELVDEGADILTGTYSSRVTSAAATAAEAEGVPFVIDVSTAASILQEREFDYVYRTQPNSAEMARNTVTHTLRGAEAAGVEPSTAGVFYVDTTYGQSIQAGLQSAVEGTDLDIVVNETIGFGGTADTQVTAFREADPDVVFPTVFPSQFMEFVGAMRDQEYWPPIFSGAASAGFRRENFQEIGGIINGSLSTGYRLDPANDRAQEVSQRFAETYDTAPMESNQGMSYATGEVMIAAFEQAGSTDPEELNGTLQEIEVSDHVMAMPPITFREDGENENALAVTAQVQDLEAKLVYPEEFAITDVNAETVVSN